MAVGAGCIIAFLYGFFLSFASGVPAFFEKHPGRKYRGQTLVIFRTLTAKLATMGVVMATISLLFTATLLSEGSGMVFSALFQNRMEKVSAFDLYIGTKDQAHLAAYQAYLNRAVPVTSAGSTRFIRGRTPRSPRIAWRRRTITSIMTRIPCWGCRITTLCGP